MRKGQAAMEFLMTYGWAILVVLAAIGALAYFGVLSPDRFLPDKCTANPPFACTQYKVDASADTADFRLQNSAGVDISITNVELLCDSAGVAAAPTSVNGAAAAFPYSVQNGNAIDLQWTAAALPAGCGQTPVGVGADLVDGARLRGTYTITYIRSSETVDHTGTGSIQVRVEA